MTSLNLFLLLTVFGFAASNELLGTQDYPFDLDNGQVLRVDYALKYSELRKNPFNKQTTVYYYVKVNNNTVPVNFEFYSILDLSRPLMFGVNSDTFKVDKLWYQFTVVGNLTVTNPKDNGKTLNRSYQSSLNKNKPRSLPQYILKAKEIMEEGWYDEKADKINLSITLQKYNDKKN